jgi:hypothetical protein
MRNAPNATATASAPQHNRWQKVRRWCNGSGLGQVEKSSSLVGSLYFLQIDPVLCRFPTAGEPPPHIVSMTQWTVY